MIESDVTCLGALFMLSIYNIQNLDFAREHLWFLSYVLGQRDLHRQDCDKAPAFELAPEQRMSFCWFQPEGPLRLRLRLGSQEPLSPELVGGDWNMTCIYLYVFPSIGDNHPN